MREDFEMRSLNTVGDNKRADKIAKALGFESAEQFKDEYVGNGVRWDMKYDVNDKQIVLENKETKETEVTDFKMPDWV